VRALVPEEMSMPVRSTARRGPSAFAFVLALVLLALPATAFAVVDRGPVPSRAVVGGVELLGLSEADARTAIVTAVPMPVMAPLDLACLGAVRSVDPTGAVRLDVDAILDVAYASTATDPYDVAPRYLVDQAAVRGWMSLFAPGVAAAPTDARYVVVNRRLRVVPSVAGRRIDTDSGAAAISAALLAEVAADGAAQPPVTLSVVPVAPRVHESSIPRALLVVLGERKLFSYRVGGGLEKTYRCAIGLSRYPTPRGTFKVVGKRVMPGWYNPGSKWARSMPRYIKPGPSNPLGTRALYLNASGIRIHGTSQVRSIGRAASHGCVRLVRKDIESLFTKIPVGTAVFIVK
jgi:lipoprotein-anchoring transpeptidase ErfK/SrfK